ncbi:type II secretion system minor pseudopilin GspH [Providencia alcalifaciens]|uniref:type II secretion system minor pseudopilin GspH n=2 Tax=Providencia alcalifaciens TaxID=126385 RepID=UPI001CC82A96|nr:Putative type II secretion system protein H [Providencia alcalifaciens]CAG9435725.1 Putative type II secretion system protein H [Providencia alcalifaciens]CAG9435744.1 Putative type II secretion system protein H [Providencia alcalifaciens]CAG9435749.1 Putative type II secretion system protein H [Providencia alcalifaciens]CAG9435941.1 Putative type II secretion system protein H [Providencia alcalifaciens]
MIQRGFTLLEMMLVILLIGSAASLVLMSYPVAQQWNLQEQREHFLGQLDFALDSSQQDGLVLGLRVHPQGWEFLFLQRKNPEVPLPVTGSDIWQEYVWQIWQPRRAAMGGKLPKGITLELQLQGLQKWSLGKDDPDILLLPGGEVTPFTLLFRKMGSDAVSVLQVDENGVSKTTEDEVVR